MYNQTVLVCVYILTFFVIDRSGLEESERVEQMQEPILEALKHYVRSRRKDQPNVFAKILYKLTDLRSISVKGRDKCVICSEGVHVQINFLKQQVLMSCFSS